jgi:inhibitor of cysteine peptidase
MRPENLLFGGNKMKRNRMLIIILAMIVMIATACAPAATPEPTPLPEPPELPGTGPGDGETGQNAYVDEIDVLILESFPVQVNVVVRGMLPDGCTYLDEFDVVQDGNTFNITVWTIRDPDAICTMALVPFEETVSLDVEGLPAGEYTVVVQDQTETFTLDIDNVPQE